MTLSYSIEMSEEGFHISVETLFKGSHLEGERLHSTTLSELKGKVETISDTLELFNEGKYVSASGIFISDERGNRSDTATKICTNYKIRNQQVGIFPPYIVVEERVLDNKSKGQVVFVFISMKEAETHISRILDLISDFTEN